MDNAKDAAIHNRTIMHPAIKLRHIRTFLAIATDGTLSSVARANRLSQPALSRTLAELERLLGAPLFLRQGRRLVLTDVGRTFRHRMTEAMALLDSGAAAIRSGDAPARLRLGVLPTAASRLFPALALRLHAAEPSTVLTVLTGSHDDLLRQLREGRIDLMIGRMPAAADIVGLSFTYLYDEDVVFVLRADHPERGADPVDLIGRLPVILPPEGAIIRRAVDDWMATQGISRPQTAFETASSEIGRGLVLASDAGWLISRGVVHAALARGEVVALPLGAGFLSGPMGIVHRTDLEIPPLVSALMQTVRDLT